VEEKWIKVRVERNETENNEREEGKKI